jgi:hypothetical protein
VGRALDNSLDEIAGVASSGNQEEIKRTLNDVVRSSLSVSFKDKLEGLTKEISVDFSESLQGLDKVMKDYDLSENFMQDISGKVGNALQGDLMSKISDGKGALNVGFKALAGAGIAATVLNPILGVIIILLPDLLGGLMKLFGGGGGDTRESQRDKIRTDLSGRVFPDIKRKLRTEIPAHLDEQLDVIIKSVGEQYEEQIKQQSEIIKAQVAEKSVSKEEAEAKQKQLEEVRNDVQRISSEIREWRN